MASGLAGEPEWSPSSQRALASRAFRRRLHLVDWLASFLDLSLQLSTRDTSQPCIPADGAPFPLPRHDELATGCRCVSNQFTARVRSPRRRMPKVKHFSAAWLSGDAPGHRLFEPSAESIRSRALSPPYSSKKKAIPGPRRTIARRGTEVFVAVGKEIRWADLAYLKDEWTTKQSRGRAGSAIRIKREDSYQSIEGDGEVDSAAGFRVRNSRADHEDQILTYADVENASGR